MTEKKPIFRFVDELIFKQVDSLKKSQVYQDVMAQLNSLNDFQLKTLNQIVSLLVVVIPIFILMIIFFMNIRFNSQLQLKREILDEINSFTYAEKNLQTLGKNIISGAALNRRKDFSDNVSNSMATSGGDRTSLSVLDFESVPTDGIVKATGVVKFKSLSTEVLALFLGDLVDRGKFRISNLQIKKNLKDNVVGGQIELLHYGRAAVPEK